MGLADPLAGLDELTVSAWLTSLTDARGAETGRLLLLRDITDRTAMEWRLRDLLAEQTRLADALQAGLRPASLPHVPGVRIAARWVPAVAGAPVSGDFFDVHSTLGGDHAFVLGDVSGRGVGPAVLTSMARFTTRTLSAQGWTPSQVLEQLNQALLAEEMTTKGIGPDDDRTCTIVYGRIARLGDEEVGEGVVLTLALGGHPPPLVRRQDGTVETVGRPGDVLGVTPTVEVSEVSVHLRPGEVLLTYTDGVTHARRESRRFGEQRLAHLLGATAVGTDGSAGVTAPGMTAAGLVADAIADRVLAAVRDFAVSHDDLAVLVVAVA